MRVFRDIESGKKVTEQELREEYLFNVRTQPEEFASMSFAEYLSNSLTRNNGTLEEVHMEQIKREEVIFDAAWEIAAMHDLDWWPADTDSRDIFQEVEKFADFFMTAYEPLFKEEEYEDSYLEFVTLAAMAWFKSYCGCHMTDDEEFMICNNQRVAQYVRSHHMALADYDWWSHLEDVVGEPVTCEEYRKLQEQLEDDILDIAECEGNRKDLKARLDYIRKPKERVPVYAVVKKMVKAWVEVPVGSGRENILAEAKEYIIEGKCEEDDGWEVEPSDIVEYNIDWDGIQEAE